MPHTLQLSHVDNVYRQLNDSANQVAAARAWRRDARSQGGDGLQKLRLLIEVAGFPCHIESIERVGKKGLRFALGDGSAIDPVALQVAIQAMAPRSGFSAFTVHPERPRSIGQRWVDWAAASGIAPLQEIALTYQKDRDTTAAARAQMTKEREAAQTQRGSGQPGQPAQYQQARYAARVPGDVPTTRGVQSPSH